MRKLSRSCGREEMRVSSSEAGAAPATHQISQGLLFGEELPDLDQNTGYPLEMADAEANANQTPPTKLTYRTGLNGHIADLATNASPEGRTWSFGYDDKGNLTSATDPAGTASPAAASGSASAAACARSSTRSACPR